MCLAVPGRIVSLGEETIFGRAGVVDFGGLTRQVSLTFVPEAREGDWVLVHVGFALSLIDDEEARRLLADLETLAALAESAEAEDAAGGPAAPGGPGDGGGA